MKRILVLLGALFVSVSAFAQTPTPIVPTPSGVVPSDQAIIKEFAAGASIVAGDLLYVDTDNRAKLADADGGSASAANVACMALGSASNTTPPQRVRCVAYDPSLTVSQTVAAGELYVLSGVAGRMSTVTSLVSGSYTTVVGIGISTTKLFFNPISSGAAQ